MQRCIQDKTDVPDDERLHELLVDITEACQIARRAPSKGCVYVMAVPNIEAVRIGRTVDLPQRLRWFEYKNFPVEVILLGKGNAFDPEAKKAEALEAPGAGGPSGSGGQAKPAKRGGA